MNTAANTGFSPAPRSRNVKIPLPPSYYDAVAVPERPLGADDFPTIWSECLSLVRERSRKEISRTTLHRIFSLLHNSTTDAAHLARHEAVRAGLRHEPAHLDDILQEVAIALWEKLRAKDERALPASQVQVRRWLSTTTRNLTHAEIRKAARVAFEAGDEPPEEDEPNGQTSEAKTPVRDLIAQLTLAKLATKLTDEEIFHLEAYIEGISHKEIAAELGITVSTSRVRRNRALEHAAKALSEPEKAA